MNLNKEKIDNDELFTTEVKAGEIKLPDFANIREGEELVFMAYDAYSAYILPVSEFNQMVAIARKNANKGDYPDNYDPNEELNNIYGSFICKAPAKVSNQNNHSIVVVFADLGNLKLFLSKDIMHGQDSLVFQNFNGRLRMYYNIEAYKTIVCKYGRRRG